MDYSKKDIDMKALEMHLNIKKPEFMEKNEKLNENDDLYLEKVKEMTEYYMEVDRVLSKMDPNPYFYHNDSKIVSNVEDIEMKVIHSPMPTK